MATLLLNQGADIEATPTKGGSETPLVISIVYGHQPMSLLLLQHGANPNGPSKSYSPAYTAWVMGDTTTTKLIISHGATPLPASMKYRPVTRG